MTIYSAGRDVMRMRNADWHDKYTLPSLWDFYQPNRNAHGAYWFDWTTEDEIAVEELLPGVDVVPERLQERRRPRHHRLDSGFIYQTYGFGYILEFEMLQEAGFHPLEVIRSATLLRRADAARAEGQADRVRHHPAGPARRHGDHRAEPARELQGALRHRRGAAERQHGKAERVGGIDYTIKDGIVYDAKKLAADVAAIVAASKKGPVRTTAPDQGLAAGASG